MSLAQNILNRYIVSRIEGMPDTQILRSNLQFQRDEMDRLETEFRLKAEKACYDHAMQMNALERQYNSLLHLLRMISRLVPTVNESPQLRQVREHLQLTDGNHI